MRIPAPLVDIDDSKSRRGFNFGLMSVSISLYSFTNSGDGAQVGWWNFFRNSYLSADGAVRDTGNENISHSEGQGYGMLLAVAFGDRPVFERLLRWTQGNLGVRDDALFAWRKYPGRPVQRDDSNNATDGDILIAWGLLRAARAWQSEEYRRLAARIAREILSKCVVEIEGDLVLRPGSGGFDRPTHLVVNLSYYVFPALYEFAQQLPDRRWNRLIAHGLTMMDHARYGRSRLIPDWVAHPRGVGRMVPAAGWPARFSWDAVRIPLYMGWAGHAADPALDPVMEFWFDPRWVRGSPAWWDLNQDIPAPYGATSGIRAVAALMLALRLNTPREPLFPRVSASEDYYNCALNVLSRLAWAEARPVSAPMS